MSYQRTTGHEYDDGEEDCMIAIGEVQSEEDGHIAGVTLHELGIPFELVHNESQVDHIRRFLEGWSAGKRLFVRPQDAARTQSVVGLRLAPTQIWTDPSSYLEQCPTAHLLKLLDFRAIWKEPWEEAVLDTAAKGLASRGVTYPPDGTCSKFLPIIYLLVAACLGPLSLFLPSVNRMRRTEDGGTRPRYDEKTRFRLERCRRNGMIAWCALYLLLCLFLKLTIPRQKENTQPQMPVIQHSQTKVI